MNQAKSTQKLKNLLFIAAGVLFLACGPIPGALAQTPAATPCDPNYYSSLKARAWLEAQREVTQNQNLIYKPDSVLEYTCFDKYLNVLAGNAQNLFSESGRWGSIMPADSMDKALQSVVGAAIQQYITANFESAGSSSYDLLGGRLSILGGTYKNTDHPPAAINITGGPYGCNIMNQVWMAAKCMDFIPNETADKDGFFTFAEYQANPDKRFLPQQCPAMVNNRWQNEINTASVPANTPWTEDNVVTYFGLIHPPNCVTSGSIETGLIVRSNGPAGEYPEKVCFASGCAYNPMQQACCKIPLKNEICE